MTDKRPKPPTDETMKAAALSEWEGEGRAPSHERKPKRPRDPAQHHELTADFADSLTIVLPEIGYCFEIRHQATSQPDQLDVALALPLHAPTRLHPIEVSIDVDLLQRRRMVSRPSCRLGLDAAKAKPRQIKLIDKDIDRPDRIVLAQIVV